MEILIYLFLTQPLLHEDVLATGNNLLFASRLKLTGYPCSGLLCSHYHNVAQMNKGGAGTDRKCSTEPRGLEI